MSLLATVRSTILSGFKALPLLLVGFIGFLSIGLGNLSLFLLFIGHAVFVPIFTEISHGVFTTGKLIIPNDVSQLVPLSPTSGSSYTTSTNVVPSYWMAHISFFFGYLFMNAISVYTMTSDKNAADWMIISRKTRAATLIATSLFLLVILTFLRFYLTGIENPQGIAVAIGLMGGLGILWSWMATSFFGVSASDIFGVAHQMVTQDTGNKKPVTCVYAPKAK